MNMVVSGSAALRASAISVPSILLTKTILRSLLEYDLSASQTITGPKSDPPIPMLTIVSIDLPVYPLHSPDLTESENSFM